MGTSFGQITLELLKRFWVNFKLFGATGLMLVFVLAQGFLLSKYMEEKK